MLTQLLDKKGEIIAHTDPERIYVENIRSFFSIPKQLAKLLCEMAVKEGVFEKRFGIICSNPGCERIISSYSSKNEIPKIVECYQCEVKGEEIFSFDSNELEIIEFYKLIR